MSEILTFCGELGSITIKPEYTTHDWLNQFFTQYKGFGRLSEYVRDATYPKPEVIAGQRFLVSGYKQINVIGSTSSAIRMQELEGFYQSTLGGLRHLGVHGLTYVYDQAREILGFANQVACYAKPEHSWSDPSGSTWTPYLMNLFAGRYDFNLMHDGIGGYQDLHILGFHLVQT